MKTQIEKKQVRHIALYSFLASLPISVGATFVAAGNTVQWAKLQRMLEVEQIYAQEDDTEVETGNFDGDVSATSTVPIGMITYSGVPGVWTNATTETVTVIEVLPSAGDSGDSGDSG